MALQWHAGKKAAVRREVHRLLGLSAVILYEGAEKGRLSLYDCAGSWVVRIPVTLEQWRDPAELAQRLHLEYIQKLIAGDE
jgi:hypothetical protein